MHEIQTYCEGRWLLLVMIAQWSEHWQLDSL